MKDKQRLVIVTNKPLCRYYYKIQGPGLPLKLCIKQETQKQALRSFRASLSRTQTKEAIERDIFEDFKSFEEMNRAVYHKTFEVDVLADLQPYLQTQRTGNEQKTSSYFTGMQSFVERKEDESVRSHLDHKKDSDVIASRALGHERDRDSTKALKGESETCRDTMLSKEEYLRRRNEAQHGYKQQRLLRSREENKRSKLLQTKLKHCHLLAKKEQVQQNQHKRMMSRELNTAFQHILTSFKSEAITKMKQQKVCSRSQHRHVEDSHSTLDLRPQTTFPASR